MKRHCLWVLLALLVVVSGCSDDDTVAPQQQVDPTIPPAYVDQWGSQGSGDGQFESPQDIAVDKDGNVYVTDSMNNRVQKFDGTGTLLKKWTTDFPRGIVVDNDGNVYVTDGSHQVLKYDANGQLLDTFVGPGAGFSNPKALALDGDGNIYVADLNGVQKLSSDGTFLLTFDNGEFNIPFGVHVRANGDVYVSDYGSFSADDGHSYVHQFHADGSFVQKFGGWGTDPGKLIQPHGLCGDGKGYLYITDGANERIQKFGMAGKFITRWGVAGTGDGEFDYPTGICRDANGNLYVVDKYAHRVQKFK